MELKGAAVVITGGGGGIGRAMAQAFVGRGARVVVCDLAEERAEAVAADLGPACTSIRLDVTSEQDWETLRRKVGPVDIVCCNAGVGHTTPLDSFDLEAFKWVHDVNLFGALLGVRTFMPAMKERGRGHFVFSCSITALRPVPFQSAYSSSKAALANAALALEQELRGSGVGVSVLMPGMVATGLRENSDSAWAEHRAQAVPEGGAPSPLATGMAPEAIGRAVADAVGQDLFWIFPHDGYQRALRREAELIRDAIQRSPAPTHRDPQPLLDPIH